MMRAMLMETFISTVAAVLIGNALSMIVAYGLWRATKIERKLGVKNGGDFLPLPLLLGMIIPFGVVGWASFLLH